MAYARADFPEGGFRTRTSGAPGLNFDFGGGRGGGMGWLEELARRRASQMMEGYGLQNDLLREQLEQTQWEGRRARGPQLATWDSPQGLENAARRAQISMMGDEKALSRARRQAMTGGPPMKMQFGPGVIPGYMPDVNAMSGVQRQIFLPGGSQEIGVQPSGSAMFAAQRGQAAGQQAADEWGVQRTAGLMQGGFFPSPGPTSYAGPLSSPAWAEDERRRRQQQSNPAWRLFNPQYGGGQ